MKNYNLIKNLEELRHAPEHDYFYINRDMVLKVLARLKEHEPFDVLQHLRDGGVGRDKIGNLYRWKSSLSRWQRSRTDVMHNWITFSELDERCFLSLLQQNLIKPYTPPPAEGSREWAMEQDANVRWENWSFNIYHNFVTNKGSAVGDYFYTEAQYDNGWSIHVEPRAPGWYSAQLGNPGANICAWEWNGESWVHAGEEFKDDEFTFIGKTRIELETPERES